VIVVADTSVLLNLCRVGQVDLLRQLFNEVVIPPEVAAEFVRLSANAGRFHNLVLPLWIRQKEPTEVPNTLRDNPGLDAGEIAAISLAFETRRRHSD
jgi:predicted nucleic acid-binding protein